MASSEQYKTFAGLCFVYCSLSFKYSVGFTGDKSRFKKSNFDLGASVLIGTIYLSRYPNNSSKLLLLAFYNFGGPNSSASCCSFMLLINSFSVYDGVELRMLSSSSSVSC